MIRSSKPWDAVLSLVEKRLGLLLLPDCIAVLVSVVTLSLLATSLLVPVDALTACPALLGIGQNTLISLFLFALTLRYDLNSRSFVLVCCGLASIFLAGMVVVQTLLAWLPQDAWHRVLLNTTVAAQHWPGRMSVTEAILLIMTFGASLLLRLSGSTGIVVSGVVIALVATISAARTAASFLGITVVAPDSNLAGAVNPLVGVLLFFISMALVRIFISHPRYLVWEAKFPGQSTFLKVAALLSLLLVAAATITLGYAREGQIGTAAIVMLLLAAMALLVIYFCIVSVVDERRRAELTLRDREEALEKAQSIGRLGSWRLFWPQGVLEWSSESYRIFGVRQGTPLSLETFMSHIHPDDLVSFQETWRRGLAGEGYDIEHRIIAGKRTKWVRERADFQWNSAHTECECLGTVQDVTDSKLKEIELLRSRELVRKLAAHNEEIREQERTKIARELHDEMGQHLTALRLQTAMVQMQQDVSNPLNGQLQDIKSRIDNTINVVRTVAASLRPPALDAGLVAATRWMLRNCVESAGITTQLESNVDESLLSDGLKTASFRILQESLTNVIRHSKATKILVWITQEAHTLTISVADNGNGFNPDEVSAELHFGLIGIRERVLNFQGTTSIQSAPGKGCCVCVTLPLDGIINQVMRAG
ncbi:MAG: histidine kinase [Pseudohongiella sp.]|nr:histidine kinase [Pseudohongiella sp.]